MGEGMTGFPLLPVLPEVILGVGALALLMIGVFTREGAMRLITWLAVVLIIVAGVALAFVPASVTAFNGAFVVDPFAHLMKLLVLLGSAVAIVMSVGYMTAAKIDRFEFPVLIITATFGMLLMISANDLIALYLGLETQSLSLYVIAAINRDSVKSTEAGLKYFVLGALSSGMLLYGASLIYGFTGTVNFIGIAKATQGGAGLGLIFGLVFLFAGFCRARIVAVRRCDHVKRQAHQFQAEIERDQV